MDRSGTRTFIRAGIAVIFASVLFFGPATERLLADYCYWETQLADPITGNWIWGSIAWAVSTVLLVSTCDCSVAATATTNIRPASSVTREPPSAGTTASTTSRSANSPASGKRAVGVVGWGTGRQRGQEPIPVRWAA